MSNENYRCIVTYHHLRDPQVIKEITASFQVGTMTIEDLAQHYGASTTKIRSILAEAGLVKYRSHKTEKEKAILEFLKIHGIETVEKLRTRLLTLETAEAMYSSLPIETRIQWLSRSTEKVNQHEDFDPIQHPELHTGSTTCN